jgi:peroxiredoxin
MTSRTARRHEEHRREVIAAEQHARQSQRALRRNIAVSAAIVLVIAGVVAAMMLTSKPTSSASTRIAPDFTLSDTAGHRVHLAAYRGHTVVLYFSEGAGCGSCLQQMGAIEKDHAAFDKAGVTVLPIVMNTRDQITADMRTYGVTTPFLLDDGKAATAYKTIGHGMHAGLPGHSFVLIDKDGVQRWYGEYPSMYLAPSDLLAQVAKHLEQ